MTTDGADGRLGTRTNMFIAAVIQVKGLSSPVKVRNMSERRIDRQSVALRIGDRILVYRGNLSAAGIVAWSGTGRCGVQFQRPIMVRAWMAPATNPGQSMVDDLIGQARARSIAQESDLFLAVDEGGSDGSAGRLAKAVALIEALADTLAEDPDIVARHGFSLQNLDLALQHLQPLSAATLR